MAANYLPLLIVSVSANATTPDDSSVTTLPTSQVDYLSHQWREEDVWSSWRSMTRQKNAIANGTRLENASWRTWWKQRNKLKTISPETLNWLKDSDVTWLYGPLHPGMDWYPLAEKSSGTTYSSIPCQTGVPVTKPILKHRSIGELLTLPPANFYEIDENPEAPVCEDLISQPLPCPKPSPSRPPLLHTKSDTHIARHDIHRALRHDSPPRIFSKDPPLRLQHDETSSTETSTGSELDLAPANSQSGKKKHISFNTFVEQCIAIEKPKQKRSETDLCDNVGIDDDGYDEDSEAGYEEAEEHRPPLSRSSKTYYPAYEPDSDSDSDDVLEMHTSSSRSRSSSSSRSGPSTLYHSSHSPSPEQSPSSIDKDPKTIAYIAPTVLKATGVGNNLPTGGYNPGHLANSVELVYVPPPRTGHRGSRTASYSRSNSQSDIYERQVNGYSDSHGSSSQSSSSTSSDSPKLTSPDLASPSNPLPTPKSALKSESQWNDDYSESLLHSEPIVIPVHDETIVAKDAFDYLVGPYLGEDFSEKKVRDSYAAQRSGDFENQRDVDDGVLKYAQGGAESVTGGRTSDINAKREESPIPTPPAITRPPEQFSATPAPYVPRAASFDHSPKTNSRLLSPPEVSRGRSSPTSCPPSVSGSTTSPSMSQSHSTDSRSESRGRSSTRNSSFSDRERSGSRSSRGTSSPLGSISPSGSFIGVSGQHCGRSVGGNPGRERGRERAGRRLNGSISSSPSSSLSPPNPTSPARSPSVDYQPYQPTQSDLYPSLAGSVVDSCSCTSTGSNSSTVGPPSSNSDSTPTPGSENDGEGLRAPTSMPQQWNPRFTLKSNPLTIPSPIPEEDELRSRNSTPANSPVIATRPILPIVPPHLLSPGITIRETPPSPEKARPSGSPTRGGDSYRGDIDGEPQVGTLVGRAVEIVSSARGLLGSLWHN